MKKITFDLNISNCDLRIRGTIFKDDVYNYGVYLLITNSRGNLLEQNITKLLETGSDILNQIDKKIEEMK